MLSDYYKEVKEKFFYKYDLDEVLNRNAVDFHMMTGEHTEVLGQFMDNTGMNVEQLKDCLIKGWLCIIKG